MSTIPPSSPDPGSVWPPPPTQPVITPMRRPFVSLLPLTGVLSVLGVIELCGLIGFTLLKSPQLQLGLLIIGLLGLLFILAALGFAAGFLRWVFTAYKNLSAFETAGLETTAGWAVGWFFVPLINLYRPYMIFHEIWKASDPDVDNRDEIAWQQVPSSPLIGWWWAFTLLNFFLPVMLNKVLTHGLPETASNTVSVVLGTASMVLTLAIINTIARRQEAKAKALAPTFPSYQ